MAPPMISRPPDFNPRPLAGATGGCESGKQDSGHFNPRPLAGATGARRFRSLYQRISIHAPLRGRLGVRAPVKDIWQISIHAPLRGRHRRINGTRRNLYFNPRPLAGATDLHGDPALDVRFQSTPPCGGDTIFGGGYIVPQISIHAPLRGRPDFAIRRLKMMLISIHAPLRGRLRRRPGC